MKQLHILAMPGDVTPVSPGFKAAWRRMRTGQIMHMKEQHLGGVTWLLVVKAELTAGVLVLSCTWEAAALSGL